MRSFGTDELESHIPAVAAGEETHSMPVAPAVPIQGVALAASDAQYRSLIKYILM
jgi:hypothetical protein